VPATLAPGYEFSADPAHLDHARVHALLTRHAYWAAGRSREVQDAAIAGSRNYGIYATATGEQVAYARVVTDGATFGWLADVVVDPAHRRRGIAHALVDAILDELAPLRLRRILLRASGDGAGLYPQHGWTALDEPDSWMVLYPEH
jgi:GNAT superfamily N-acetyltransferase